jgi:putative solute:sodium symporter small subunit
MQADVRNALEQRKREYWRKNQRMIAVLMVIGFVVTYVVAYFARDLNFKFFGWPFSFWMAAQGALLVYVALVWFYARFMNRLDLEYGFEEIVEPREGAPSSR